MKKKVLRALRLCAVCVLLLPFACQPATPAGGGGGETALPVQLRPAATPSPSPAEASLPTAWPQALAYDPLRLPAYAEEFLGESLADYRALVAAIAAGEPRVTLSARASFPKLERTMNALCPQKMLLFDARYTQGEGPLAYDTETHTVTIRYLYDAGTHRELMQAFEDRMNDALLRCTPGMGLRQQAEALYLWVIENLYYELDMRLTVYDAVTTGAAYCQTYSMLYQHLLTQAGIPCYQVGGSVDTDGDGVADGEHQWNRLLLDGAWYYADPTWDAGDLRFFCLTYEECLQCGYLAPFCDPCDALLD